MDGLVNFSFTVKGSGRSTLSGNHLYVFPVGLVVFQYLA